MCFAIYRVLPGSKRLVPTRARGYPGLDQKKACKYGFDCNKHYIKISCKIHSFNKFFELSLSGSMLLSWGKKNELVHVWQQADIDGNGTLNCEEFITMSVHLRRIGNDELLSEAFNYFDKNQSGYVEFEELKEALSDDDSSDDQVIRDILNDVDLDKVRTKKTVLHINTLTCKMYRSRDSIKFGPYNLTWIVRIKSY